MRLPSWVRQETKVSAKWKNRQMQTTNESRGKSLSIFLKHPAVSVPGRTWAPRTCSICFNAVKSIPFKTNNGKNLLPHVDLILINPSVFIRGCSLQKWFDSPLNPESDPPINKEGIDHRSGWIKIREIPPLPPPPRRPLSPVRAAETSAASAAWAPALPRRGRPPAPATPRPARRGRGRVGTSGIWGAHVMAR